MSQNIRSLPLGSIFYQSGNGVPTHIANKGCNCQGTTGGYTSIERMA